MSNLRRTAGPLFLFAVISCSQESKEKSSEQIWKDASRSIVYVTARGVDGKVVQGSGFFVKLEGKNLVLTNRHVVDGAEEVTIAPQGKNPKRSSSYKISPDLDLAVIECPNELETRPLSLGKGQLNPGAEVYALGFPLGVANVISRGIVGAVEDNYFLFDAPISSGNSGGPVINHMGDVIGVATMGSRSTDQAIVQNLNVGVRVTAIPRLQLFSDPVFRIKAVSDRIRQVERIIEDGFLREDFFTLHDLVCFEWMQQNVNPINPSEWQRKVTEFKQKRDAWQTKHGAIREGVRRWVDFLKTCEAQIDAIPSAFAGLGSDALLEKFLKTDVGFKVGVERVNATAENLPELARIGADHWLATFEDLRYHLEWLLRYGDLPSSNELLSDSNGERPAIRLKFSITGNRENDLEQYHQTELHWYNREDVRRDSYAQIEQRSSGRPVTDPIANEKLHGNFLKQVSSFRQYLAIGAGDRGNFDQAINLLARDLEDRSPSTWSGGLLAEYLVFVGRVDDAWRAYRQYFWGEPAFDAFALAQDRDINGSPIRLDIVERISGIAGSPDSPEILHHIEEWNVAVNIVDGRRLATLGPLAETLSDEWFKKLDDFSKLRVLLYYRYTRPVDEMAEYYQRTGEWPKRDVVKQQDEFTATLRTSKEAEAIWMNAVEHHGVDFPL